MKTNFIIFSLLCLYGSAAVKVDDVLNHLGSNTPYRFIQNRNESKIKFPGCKDKKIWIAIRHGTRYPSNQIMIQMNTTLYSLRDEILLQNERKKGPLTPDKLQLFKDWKPDSTMREKELTQEGREEMVLLAERIYNRFPGAMPKSYDKNKVTFQFTATNRTEESAKYFALGLFDRKELNNIDFQNLDVTLRFYKHCEKWLRNIKQNNDTFRERQIFVTSDIMAETLKNVSQRLGLASVLSLDEVQLMYKTCGFETAWSKYNQSPWCFAFDNKSIQVLEYGFDLKHYWADGYGYELTHKIACSVVKTMFDQFTDFSSPVAKFHFFHSGSLLKIISHLGLFKPQEHLRASYMDEHRVWRMSEIDAFGSNLVFVLYGCKDGDYVLTLYQERVIKLSMCAQELCPLNVLTTYFKDTIDNCNHYGLCAMEREEL